MAATYTKLRSGNWGVRVDGTVKKGDIVTVQKKSGETKEERIAAVVFSGNGISLCAIAPAGKSYRPRGDGGPRGDRACYMCGSYYCEGARGGLCEDD